MSWDGKGSTRAWRRTRRAILDRDQHTCQLRLPGCTTRATEVHHVLGKGTSEQHNQLVASCQNCNGKIGDPTRNQPNPRPGTQW